MSLTDASWLSNPEDERSLHDGLAIAPARPLETNFLTDDSPTPAAWKPKNFRSPVFDVGMHDGTDTAFYLHQGHAVLAIEADPALAEAGARRFADAVARGQLHVLNVGIAEAAGTASFWICEDHSVWNSFDVQVASRNGSRHHPISISTWRFGEVIDRFGVPVYLKIDIEGADALCVRDLRRDALPKFISVESECVGDGEVLANESAIRMLDLLRDAGYTRFKLVSQCDFTTARYPDRWRFVRSVIDSVAFGKLSRLGVGGLAKPLTARERLRKRKDGYQFECGGRGPWADGLLGRWSSYADARNIYLQLRDQFFSRPDVKPYAFWYDWHASY